jgi:hypothetical protein
LFYISGHGFIEEVKEGDQGKYITQRSSIVVYQATNETILYPIDSDEKGFG